MKKFYTTLVIALVSINSFAQQSTFQKVLGINGGGTMQTMDVTLDGGYIIAGASNITTYGHGLFFLRTNMEGDTLWTKNIDQGNYNDYVYNIRQVSDGGFVLTGSTWNIGNHHEGSMFLMKIDSDGNFIWEKIYAAPYLSTGINLRQTSDGGYIVIGQASFDSIHRTAFLVKTNDIGDTLWTRNYGASYDEIGYDVCETNDNGYVLTGSNYNNNGVPVHVFVIKTDSLGNTLWSNKYGGVAADAGCSIQLTSDGGYVIAGNTDSFGVIGYDFLMFKLDANGTIVFAKTFGNTSYESFGSLALTSDHGFLVTGYGSPSAYSTIYDPYAFKTDSMGNITWAKKYGWTTSDQLLSGKQTPDGGFILAGIINGFVPSSSVYLIKTDGNGSTGCFWEQNPTMIVGNPTLYNLTLTSVTGRGAIVYSVPDSVIRNINVGGESLTMCYIAAITENNFDNSISISPNPFTSQTTITFNEAQKNTSIKVMNTLGECIQQLTTSNQQLILDMSGYAKGVYFVKIESSPFLSLPEGDTKPVYKKLVLQ